MYNRDPFLNLTEETIAKIVGLDFPVDLIAKQSMSKLTEARGLDHSYLYDVSLVDELEVLLGCLKKVVISLIKWAKRLKTKEEDNLTL